MLYIKPYKQFSKFLESEAFEPMISWGVRMGIAAMLPLIWGLSTGHVDDAIWITLTAECICWVELKGSFAWRLRVLTGGALLAVFFSFIGTITGSSIWLSVVCMLAVGFISGLFKNLGDRGSSLSISVYLLFIICNAYPAHTFEAVKWRVFLILTGAIWTIIVSIIISLFMPAAQPYRRQIALIWRAIAALLHTIGMGWDGKSQRSNLRDIYQKEKDIRTAIDNSYQFYGSMAHQVSEKDKSEYQLAQLRKATGLIAINVTSIGEEIELLNIKDLPPTLRLKIASLLRALEQTLTRMAVLIVTLRPEEALLVTSRISRLKKLVTLIKEEQVTHLHQKTIARTTQLAERTIKLIETSLERLQNIGTDLPVYRSYSLFKTLFVLHPKYWINNLRLLFNFNTFTTRYALRTAIAAAIAMLIFKVFNIDHGYWLPFSVIIVIQPYFRATYKKALDRVVGTLLGGIAGGLVLRFPTSLHLKEILLFASFVSMVYYLRRNYAIAAFAITINLVLLFHIEAALSPGLILTRALCTIGGAGLAVIAGFALLPTWDKKWLPLHLTDAIAANYQYFTATFFGQKINVTWTKNKRSVESKNSNVFDSFNRYVADPGKKKPAFYYDLITHNVRITRDINNINLEQEHRHPGDQTFAPAAQLAKLTQTLHWFNIIMAEITTINPGIQTELISPDEQHQLLFPLTDTQTIYLEKLLLELRTMHADVLQLKQNISED